jgi:hypothetical protein
MSTAAIPSPASTAKLLKMAFDGCNLSSLRSAFLSQSQSGQERTAALLNLCTIEQLLGDVPAGLRRQAEALRVHRLYRSSWQASPRALRVLAFLAPGDLSANTPIDFLLQGTDVVLYSLYVVPGQPLPDPLPDHDIAIVAVGESDRARPILQTIEQLIPSWPCPVLNRPERIVCLSREKMYRVLQGIPGLVAPPTVRIERPSFEQLGRGVMPAGQFLAHGDFPLIVRTIDSHAGRGLAKIETPPGVEAYLRDHPETAFFISPYVDYRSADGLFRKFRLMWVDGRPYPCHMAIAEEWKVWYLNANMAASAAKRAEEAQFMAEFDADFGRRHAATLAAIAARFGLEYVGIDCAELPDGRLLVFEADVALVAHDMDPPEIYPYKGPQMRKLFAAFYDMLRGKSKSRSGAVQ